MANPVIKVWLRTPRLAWRNDGGPIPRGFRSLVKQRGGIKSRHLKTISSETLRRGYWAVRVGGAIFVFSPAEMRHLYSRVPK